jgi:hypothetical protein
LRKYIKVKKEQRIHIILVFANIALISRYPSCAPLLISNVKAGRLSISVLWTAIEVSQSRWKKAQQISKPLTAHAVLTISTSNNELRHSSRFMLSLDKCCMMLVSALDSN